MKNIRTYLLSLLAVGFVLALSCDEDQDLTDQRLADNPLPGPTTGSSGSLDVSKYIALGNSLSAGFMDGALYNSGQASSFPNMIATQLQISGVGGGTFNQPDINSMNGFSGLGPGNAPLGRFELSLSQLRPVPTAGELPTAYTGDKAALNNFAVPGMRLVDVNSPALAVNNGLYGRFASNPGTSTVLGQALAANPSFFTFWLGSNDVLGYATGGGTNEAQITDAASFQTELTASLGALVATGADGVVINIPPVILTPFFRAVSWNPIPLDQATADVLNGAFAGYNGVLNALAQFQLLTAEEAAARQVTYAAAPNNPLLMADDALTDIGPLLDVLVGQGAITATQRAQLEPYRIARQATSNDLPTLRAAGEIQRDVLGNGQLLSGISWPIGDEFVLSASEVVNVVTARATYNAIIDAVVTGINAQAGSSKIAVLDIQPAFADIFGLDAATATALALSPAAVAAGDGELGIMVEGTNLAPDFGPNGIFSTDGIHPNPRGHGIVTNLIIDILNTKYNASIPKVNVLALRSVLTTN